MLHGLAARPLAAPWKCWSWGEPAGRPGRALRRGAVAFQMPSIDESPPFCSVCLRRRTQLPQEMREELLAELSERYTPGGRQ